MSFNVTQPSSHGIPPSISQPPDSGNNRGRAGALSGKSIPTPQGQNPTVSNLTNVSNTNVVAPAALKDTPKAENVPSHGGSAMNLQNAPIAKLSISPLPRIGTSPTSPSGSPQKGGKMVIAQRNFVNAFPGSGKIFDENRSTFENLRGLNKKIEERNTAAANGEPTGKLDAEIQDRLNELHTDGPPEGAEHEFSQVLDKLTEKAGSTVSAPPNNNNSNVGSMAPQATVNRLARPVAGGRPQRAGGAGRGGGIPPKVLTFAKEVSETKTKEQRAELNQKMETESDPAVKAMMNDVLIGHTEAQFKESLNELRDLAANLDTNPGNIDRMAVLGRELGQLAAEIGAKDPKIKEQLENDVAAAFSNLKAEGPAAKRESGPLTNEQKFDADVNSLKSKLTFVNELSAQIQSGKKVDVGQAHLLESSRQEIQQGLSNLEVSLSTIQDPSLRKARGEVFQTLLGSASMAGKIDSSKKTSASKLATKLEQRTPDSSSAKALGAIQLFAGFYEKADAKTQQGYIQDLKKGIKDIDSDMATLQKYPQYANLIGELAITKGEIESMLAVHTPENTAAINNLRELHADPANASLAAEAARGASSDEEGAKAILAALPWMALETATAVSGLVRKQEDTAVGVRAAASTMARLTPKLPAIIKAESVQRGYMAPMTIQQGLQSNFTSAFGSTYPYLDRNDQEKSDAISSAANSYTLLVNSDKANTKELTVLRATVRDFGEYTATLRDSFMPMYESLVTGDKVLREGEDLAKGVDKAGGKDAVQGKIAEVKEKLANYKNQINGLEIKQDARGYSAVSQVAKDYLLNDIEKVERHLTTLQTQVNQLP